MVKRRIAALLATTKELSHFVVFNQHVAVGCGQKFTGEPGGKVPRDVTRVPSAAQYEINFAPAGPTTASMTGFVQLDGNTIAVAVLPTTTEICLIASRRLKFLFMSHPSSPSYTFQQEIKSRHLPRARLIGI
jgi:hypothetical protein